MNIVKKIQFNDLLKYRSNTNESLFQGIDIVTLYTLRNTIIEFFYFRLSSLLLRLLLLLPSFSMSAFVWERIFKGISKIRKYWKRNFFIGFAFGWRWKQNVLWFSLLCVFAFESHITRGNSSRAWNALSKKEIRWRRCRKQEGERNQALCFGKVKLFAADFKASQLVSGRIDSSPVKRLSYAL